MRTNTKDRPVEQPRAIDSFLNPVGHQPAPAPSLMPQTLRSHMRARQFGDFGAVLMAERPASSDLSDGVRRWREIECRTRGDMPLRAHSDQSADDRRFRFAVSVTTIVFSGWVISGLMAAWLKGGL